MPPGPVWAVVWMMFILAALTGAAQSATSQTEQSLSGLFSYTTPAENIETFAAGDELPISLNRELLAEPLQEGDVLEIPNFHGQTENYRVTGVSEFVEGHVSVRAVHEDTPYDQITFSYGNGQMLGTINRFSRGETYRILPHTEAVQKAVSETDSEHLIRFSDPGKEDILQCGVGREDRSSGIHQSESRESLDQSHLFSPFDIESSLQTGVPIDVMIVYTDDAQSWADDKEGGIELLISEMMNLSQQALENSELDISLRVVDTYHTDFQEDGNDSPGDLRKLTALPDDDRFGSEHQGYMEEIHTRRDDNGADLVAMLADVEDVGGISWLLTQTGGSSQWGFSLNRVQQLTNGYTFIHEIGHNLGGAHSRIQSRSPADVFGGLFEYSTGWYFTDDSDTTYVTVMAYTDQQILTNRIPYFSSPEILFRGVPTGNYDSAGAPADNVRSMKFSRHIVANYRPTENGPPLLIADDSVIETGSYPGDEKEITLLIGNEGNSILHWTADAGYREASLAKKAEPGEPAPPPRVEYYPRPAGRISNPYLTTEDDLLIRHRNGPYYTTQTHESVATAGSDDLSGSTLQTEDSDLNGGMLMDTGFESAEGYATGEYWTLNNWMFNHRDSLGTFSIASDHPASGSQHLRLSPIPELADSIYPGVRAPFPGALTAQRYSVSMDIRFSDTESENQFHIIINSSSTRQSTARVWFEDGSIIGQNQNGENAEFIYLHQARNKEDYLWKPGEYFNFEIRIDPRLERIQYLVNGDFIATAELYAGAAPEDILLAHLNIDTGETIDIDNFNVSSLPDPEFPRFQLRKPSGAVASGEQEEIRFRIIPDDIPEDVYEFDLVVRTNDPYEQSFTVPVRYEVSETYTSAGQEPQASGFELRQNYPNPFNPTTTISYTLPASREVRLEVININGQLVETLVEEHQEAGEHRVTFDAAGLASGIYLYRLQAGTDMQTGRMVLIK